MTEREIKDISELENSLSHFVYHGIFFTIIALALIVFCCYYYKDNFKRNPKSKRTPKFSIELENKEDIDKLIPSYLLIVFIILPIFLLFRIFVSSRRDIEDFWILWIGGAILFSLFFGWLYIGTRKSLKKQSAKFHKGLGLIESEKTILRVRGLKLLAQLLQQQIFVDEINNHTIYIDLKNANLASTKLSEVDLSGANLTNAILMKADLSKVNLSEAILDKTNLLYATNIDEATFNDVIMTDVKMDKSTFDEFKTVLSEEQLSRMRYEKTDEEIVLVTIPKN